MTTTFANRRILGFVLGLLLVLGGAAYIRRERTVYNRHSESYKLVHLIFWTRSNSPQVDQALSLQAAKLIREGAIPDVLTSSPYAFDDEEGYTTTPLHVAVGRSHPQTVRVLLEHGADVNVTDTFGQTPLIWGARFDSPEVLQILIEAGADLDRVDQWGHTALDEACGTTERNARVLVRAGAKHSDRRNCSTHRGSAGPRQ